MSVVKSLRPGVIVVLKTSLKGNTTYQKEDLAHTAEDNEEQKEWKTIRHTANVDEHDRASKTRTKASNLIRNACVKSEFGLICLEENEEKLRQGIAEARKLVDEFNDTSELTLLVLNVICGRVAQDDVEATKAISGEIKGLLTIMDSSLKKLDIDEVRAAAAKAKQVSQMLSPDAQRQVDEAVVAVRAMCTRIVKAGEEIKPDIDDMVIEKLSSARTSMLNLENLVFDDAPHNSRQLNTAAADDLEGVLNAV